MSLTFKKFHMNNAVKVKLNETGHLEMERQHNELYASVGIGYRPFTRKASDDDGYSTFQLHSLMHTFGHMMTCGGELPFEELNILLADQLLKDA